MRYRRRLLIVCTLLALVAFAAAGFAATASGKEEKVKVVEGVGSTPTQDNALTPPETLSNHFAASDRTESEFTTSIAGTLHLAKPFIGQMYCGQGVTLWSWISVDGVPVRSSLAYELSDIEPIFRTLVGVTDTVVAAGTHTMRIEGMCTEGAAMVSSAERYVGGTAIVLGG